jgi:DNA-binding response OmpR family regulator
MRVLVVEDEPYLAEAIRDGLRLEAIAHRRLRQRQPILMVTAADRLDNKATGFGLGADDYLTKPFELQELVLRLRALDRRRHNRPPVRELAGLRLDPFRREVYRDGCQSRDRPAAGVTRAARRAGRTAASSPARAAMRTTTPSDGQGMSMVARVRARFTNVS